MPAAVACMAAHELNTFGKLSLYGISAYSKTNSAEIRDGRKCLHRVEHRGTIVQEHCSKLFSRSQPGSHTNQTLSGREELGN